MPELKLAKLPDRTPSKITITVSSDLNAALRQYADVYRSAYGEDEPVAELIPFMLEAFLESDREFVKARKTMAPASAASLPSTPPRHAPLTPSTGKEA